MANAIITPDIVAKEATMILENNLTMANMVFRGFEDDFSKNSNGYKVGETINFRRPTDFTVREGKVAVIQDVQEGKLPITVDKQRGVDFKFSSSDLTLQIGEISDRILKPAMVQLANRIDVDLMALYKDIPNHVTIPSGGINSFADFALATERMDTMSVPLDDLNAILSPADYWALLGSQTGLYIQEAAKGAYRDGKAGRIAGIETMMSQNVPLHTTGARTGTDLVDIVGQTYLLGHTWDATRESSSVTFHIDGFASDVAGIVKHGDTFTISDVYDVNPITKARLSHLKMFTIKADATSASTEADVQIWPPIILDGAHQNADLSTGTLEDNTITWQGVASTGYRQNLFFHRNAFALVMVPLVKPPGAVDVGRRTYKGISVRVIPYYDGTNDDSNWRLDVLYGTAVMDARLAVRASLAADI